MATIQRAVLASAILILLTALTCDHTADALTLHKLGMFRCSDGKYISLNKVCDMQNDCEKAEDENQNCYHDECPVWGLCDQLCTNSTGPYECRCHAGYESVNRTRCVAGNRTGPPPLVYFALERHVMAVDVRRQKQVAAVVQANASSACSGVDYHYARRRLFWTETGPGRILSVPLGQDATKDEPAVITVPGHWEPVAVAVDWVGDKLYVADRAGNKVDVLELNGRWHGIAIGSGLDRPVDVALDAARGYVFVADTEGLIRADMDGSNQRRVISLGVINLSGVTVDPLAKRIYWYDQRSGYIETSDYDGARRHNVFAVGGAELLSPVRLAVFEGNVYWTDYKRGGVFGVGKNDPNTMATVYNEKEINKPKAVKVYHQLVQEPVRSPCGKHNAGCMHMCIVTKGSHYSALTYRCACNIGFQLAPDQRTCVPANEFLLYVKQSHIKGKVLNSVSQVFNDAILPITAAKYADFSGLDFDAHENYIYYSDFVTNEIFRVRRNGTGTEIVLHNIRLLGASYGVEDLAVDWVAKNLYYVDARWGTLTVMSTRNVTNKKVLMADLNTPRSIVVHPNRGYVFYTEWDEVSKPVVSRVHTDGSNKIVLNMINWHRGLALDFANDRLYWCDSQMSRVQHSNLDGKDVKTIQLTDHKHPVAMVLNNEWMYIVDSHMMIVKLDKLTGVVSNVVVHENAPQIGQLKIYSVKEQRIEAQHPCSEQMDHGGCQKLCIAVPESSVIYGSTALRAQCHCPDGEKLDADGKSCVTIQNAVKPDFECPNPWQFTCYNMRCVAKIHVCDGTNNCLDNSDEEQNCTNLKPKVERNTAIKETTTTVTTTTRKYRATQSILAYDTWSG